MIFKEEKKRTNCYQVFVTEEEKRLRNEFSCMDYLDDDDIGGS